MSKTTKENKFYAIKKMIKDDIQVHKDYADYDRLDYHAKRIYKLNEALKVIKEFEERYELMKKLDDLGMVTRLEDKGLL